MSIHAQAKGDYSAEILENLLPAVDISIVRAVLNEEKISPDELEARMSGLIDELKEPVPLISGPITPVINETPVVTFTKTPENTPVLMNTATSQTRSATITSAITRSPTGTQE